MQKRSHSLSEALAAIGHDDATQVLSFLTEQLGNLDALGMSEADLLDLTAQLYIQSGNLSLAGELYKGYLDSGLHQSDAWFRIRVFDGLAHIAFIRADYSESLEYLALATEQPIGSRNLLFNFGNSARINIKLGEFEKAIGLLEEALALGVGDDLSNARSYLSLAYAHGLRGAVDKGMMILTSMVDLNKLKDFKREQAIYYEYLGHLQYLNSLQQKAIVNLGKGLEIATSISSIASGVSQINRKLAEIYLYLGDIEEARNTATTAFTISKDIDEKYELGILHWIFAQIAINDDDPDSVGHNLILSKKILTEIGAKYELKRLFHSESTPLV
jgi:tetratricopeptide (TPR) repeat protein